MRTLWRFTSCTTIFARIHQTLRVTPAMAAGVSDHVWELSRDRWTAVKKGRGSRRA